MAFEDVGYQAHTVITCAEAFEVVERQDIHGAVLDVNLGRGHTCEEIARELHKREIPFVLHTGDLDRAGEFLRDLAAPVIAKPRPAEDVVKQVLRMTDREAA
jgi:DNA-binding NtrC family response regulator